VFASSQVGVITSPIEGITTSLGKRAKGRMVETAAVQEICMQGQRHQLVR